MQQPTFEGREELAERVAYAKQPRTLPVVLGREETIRLFKALPNPRQRLVLMTAYSAAHRRSHPWPARRFRGDITGPTLTQRSSPVAACVEARSSVRRTKPARFP